MRIFKYGFFLLLAAILGGSTYYLYFYQPVTPSEQLFTVETPLRKEIKQEIAATGSLKLKGQVKIGSVVPGRVQAIHVEENDVVAEGQLLVEIDTGLEDTEVREAEGAYERALAELEFQESNYQRQNQLFEEQFISGAALQEALRSYKTAQADVKALKATYEKKLIAFRDNKIYAPASGIIIHVDAAKGEKVTSDLEGGTLLSLAPDVKHIEAELEIHEKDIGQIKKGQSVQMVVDTYPHKVFESSIQSISFIPLAGVENECLYQAKAYIDNPRLLLRPGMTVSATIDVAKTDSALALTSRAFLIKEEHLKPVASLLNYDLNPLDPEEKLNIVADQEEKPTQFIWKECESCFQEIPVEIGLNDQIYFEIKSGLTGGEKCVVDVIEEDQMKNFYEKLYRKY